MSEGAPDRAAEDFWDEFYGQSERVWSGRPNPTLVREAAGLPPGTVLDVGCGEGADAIWLAGRGWRVTGTDISAVALQRAAAHAKEAGVAERIEWRRDDLARSFPGGSFDLVTVHFLHSPVELPQEHVMRSAAAAVAPGGTLLVAGHAMFPVREGDHGHEEGEGHGHDIHFPTPDELIDSFGVEDGLRDGRWRVEVNETVHDEITRPGGERVTRTDHVLRLRRLTG